MGLFSRQTPKIKVQTVKKDGFSGWVKCCSCHDMIHANELEGNLFCCPKCGYHYRLSAQQRVLLLADENSFKELFTEFQSKDELQFVDAESYVDRLKKAKKQSGRDEAIIAGVCSIGGYRAALGVLDFDFMGGSMGSVVGERLTSLIEWATFFRAPLVIVSASGGARMQESIYSLMQMAKTSAALARHAKKRGLYISVLTNPTMGGVTASFASLGDLILAESDALIGFSGPRVIEQTVRQKLPEGAQKPAFLKEHGLVDAIVDRKDLREKLIRYFELFGVEYLREERSLPSSSQNHGRKEGIGRDGNAMGV